MTPRVAILFTLGKRYANRETALMPLMLPMKGRRLVTA
jgi:hypothetical protein